MSNTVLAVIGKIIELNPIANADNIVAAKVFCGDHGTWHGVVSKNQFEIDDLCEVFLNDCILPKIPRFDFMEKHKYRIKMVRLRGVPSEVLIMPCDQRFPNVGDDLTKLYGCAKYEKEIPIELKHEILGVFPSFIPKTDEPNFQKSSHLIDFLIGKPYYITEKADGSSYTVYKNNLHFGICSRNLELKMNEENSIWKMISNYNLKEKMDKININFAIQFELVGGKVQGNPMGVKGLDMRVFSIYDIYAHEYFNMRELMNICKELEIPTVKFLEIGDSFPKLSHEEILLKAEGLYDSGKQREGIVVRSQFAQRVNNERVSFKILNLKY